MIGILVFPEFQLLDACGPASVFELTKRFAPHAPNVRMIAVQPGAVRSSCGVEVLAHPLGPANALTTLIVAGGLGVEVVTECKTTLSFVRRLAKSGVRIASVCSGAYILAAAGLLDGRKATTHWCRTQDFVSRYPKVKLDPDRIFLREGNVWTSAGVTAGIDLALAIAAEDHGEPIAKEVASQLVLYHRRSGGQSQFSSLLEFKTPNGRFAPLLAWVREHLNKPLTVEALADRAGLSPRHFARAFTAETGSTPSKAVERLRLEVARERVQSSGELIERVAEVTGFGDAERMRRAFVRAFGQPPQSLRRSARGSR
jgi:transcriptional regulator GlxA family with amidase domain